MFGTWAPIRPVGTGHADEPSVAGLDLAAGQGYRMRTNVQNHIFVDITIYDTDFRKA